MPLRRTGAATEDGHSVHPPQCCYGGRALRPPSAVLLRRTGTSWAFTLVEILVTIALLAFITLGLFAALDQVQRAFRSGMSQVDRLEAGRAVTEMLPRELEQTTPCGANAATFYTQVAGSSAAPIRSPLTQSLPGTLVVRTNLLQDCFILTRQNQTWVGIGYCVRTADANGILGFPESVPGQTLGVGSLYRYSATTNVLRNDGLYKGLPSDPRQLYNNFRAACVAGSPDSKAISNRICDGVIHFRLRAFATNGFPIYADSFSQARFRTNAYNTGSCIVKGASTIPSSTCPDNWAALLFVSNAVPASVELEFGILEQPSWERYNSIPASAARLAYLQRSDVSSRVQLFRQRIPIRNVNPLAYQ